MPANTAPIFTLTPNIGGVAVGGTANTKSDGQGTIATDIFKAFTAGANGAKVNSLKLMPAATAAATPTTATTHRVYVSSKTSGATTSADTFLIGEITAAAQTADHSTTAVAALVLALNLVLPAGWTILVSSHIVNAANTTWIATVDGGDF